MLSWVARGAIRVVRAPGNIAAGVLREAADIVRSLTRPLTRVMPSDSSRARLRGVAAASASRARSLRERSAADVPRTAADRRAADRRRQLVQRRTRGALVLVLLASVVAAWMVVPGSSLFQIRHVEVTGASAVGDLQVRRRVDRLLAGATVFTIDSQAVEQRIEELPFVRSATVERHLPGGIELQITEYQPLALGTTGGQRAWLIARDGRVLARADVAEWTGRVPVVQLADGEVTIGDRIGDEPALQLLANRPAASTLAIERVDVVDGQIFAALTDGTQVRFGRPAALRAKLLVAERVRQFAVRQDFGALKYIDVTVSGRPAVCRASRALCSQPRGPVDEDPEAAVAPVAGGPTVDPTVDPTADPTAVPDP